MNLISLFCIKTKAVIRYIYCAMQGAEQKNIIAAPAFYDVIAGEYNKLMTDDDEKIRLIVKQELELYVPSGNVLDFGSGTGMDLRWLLQAGYRVFSLEPSEQMRDEAKKLAAPLVVKPIFLEKNIAFEDWTEANLPTTEKMDGILANFSVINCIKDIDTLFNKLYLLCKPGAYVVATVLDTQTGPVFKHYSLNIFTQVLLNQKAVVYPHHKLATHPAYLHTIKQYKKASEKYFEFISFRSLGLSNLALMVYKRK